MREYHSTLKYLIVVDYESANKTTETLTSIFSILWENGLIDADVLSQDEFDVWSLDTFLPYQMDCAKLDHHRIASFSAFNFTKNMNLSLQQLYPVKLRNFNQCALRVGAIPSDFHVVRNISNGTHIYSGIDINIIKEISAKLNFQIIYECTDLHGEVFENGTLTGSIKMVCINNCHKVYLFQ